ncbi:MAG TPA: hypothetical protein VLF39_03100 [Candidatus Saccharimonadales bacterium]|nr:hypothetical protein [Candidatus Saccharimonadales bacterium]
MSSPSNSPSNSPSSPNKPSKHLTFSEAIAELLAGKSITKLEWDDTDYYGVLADDRLRLHKPDGELYDWILSEADLKGDDFIVL